MQISAADTTAGLPATDSSRRRPPGPPPEAMQAAASALRMSNSDLTSAVKSGTTIADLAKQKGVSTDSLVSSITTALKSNKPSGAPELSADQLTAMATSIVNGTGPAGGPPPGGMGATGNATASTNPAADFRTLAQDLGVDAGDLMDQLRNGDTSSLSSLLQTQNAMTGYGASSTSVSGLLADIQA